MSGKSIPIPPTLSAHVNHSHGARVVPELLIQLQSQDLGHLL
jgi:hypothetical protein